MAGTQWWRHERRLDELHGLLHTRVEGNLQHSLREHITTGLSIAIASQLQRTLTSWSYYRYML